MRDVCVCVFVSIREGEEIGREESGEALDHCALYYFCTPYAICWILFALYSIQYQYAGWWILFVNRGKSANVWEKYYPIRLPICGQYRIKIVGKANQSSVATIGGQNAYNKYMDTHETRCHIHVHRQTAPRKQENPYACFERVYPNHLIITHSSLALHRQRQQ